ncbi:hypothetical protein Scep_009347 [Stephania cephalantha]|uniref:Uncharacterized protein n=1 Tax=Stephania cephalantha TaxID=152367 RepID=A0AAP0JTI4_9MAGN
MIVRLLRRSSSVIRSDNESADERAALPTGSGSLAELEATQRIPSASESSDSDFESMEGMLEDEGAADGILFDRAENVHIQLDIRIPNSIVENEVRAITDLYADLDARGMSLSPFELEGGLSEGEESSENLEGQETQRAQDAEEVNRSAQLHLHN